MNCANCGNPVKKYNKFCNMRCSAVYNNKIRKLSGYSIKNISKTIYCCECNCEIVVPLNANINGILCQSCKNAQDSAVYVQSKTCIQCGSQFDIKYKQNVTHIRRYCADCLAIKNSQSGSKGGLKSVGSQSSIRRSKNEIYFADLCKQKFNSVKTNEPIFDGWDADIIIEDLKIAILWNGIWHYKKIKKSHSVAQVQNRDKIKLEKIKACGYIAYVIQDLGKFDTNFVDVEFEKFCGSLVQ
jgi:hypothetical protein